MKTIFYTIKDEPQDEKIIELAAGLINSGELVAIPTETVYGLAADGYNTKACEKIFKVKGRPSDNPLILHISDEEQLKPLVKSINANARILMDKFWPGPLTLIFEKSENVPDIVTAGGNTVAIRMPSNSIARKIISATNKPLAAPSANISGSPSPTSGKDVFHDFNGKIPLIIDDGDSNIGIESTVVDITENIPVILRPGIFTIEDLKKEISNIKLDDSIIDGGKTPKSPGQKYRHYAPKADMTIFVGDREKRIQAMKKEIVKLNKLGKKVGVLCFREDLDEFDQAFIVLDFGSENELLEITKLLFRRLRDFDELPIDYILCEGVEKQGLGVAIMNRLKKASSGKVKFFK